MKSNQATLWQLPIKHNATVNALLPTLSEQVVGRLQLLGVAVGSPLYCVRRAPFFGPIVIEVNGGQFALEKSLAQQIIVNTP